MATPAPQYTPHTFSYEYPHNFSSASQLLHFLYDNQGVDPSLIPGLLASAQVELLLDLVCIILSRNWANQQLYQHPSTLAQSLPAGTRFAELYVIDMLGINQGRVPVSHTYYGPLIALIGNSTAIDDAQRLRPEMVDFFRVLRSRVDWTAETFRYAIDNSEFYRYKAFVEKKHSFLHPQERRMMLCAKVYELAFYTPFLYHPAMPAGTHINVDTVTAPSNTFDKSENTVNSEQIPFSDEFSSPISLNQLKNRQFNLECATIEFLQWTGLNSISIKYTEQLRYVMGCNLYLSWKHIISNIIHTISQFYIHLNVNFITWIFQLFLNRYIYTQLPQYAMVDTIGAIADRSQAMKDLKSQQHAELQSLLLNSSERVPSSDVISALQSKHNEEKCSCEERSAEFDFLLTTRATITGQFSMALGEVYLEKYYFLEHLDNLSHEIGVQEQLLHELGQKERALSTSVASVLILQDVSNKKASQSHETQDNHENDENTANIQSYKRKSRKNIRKSQSNEESSDDAPNLTITQTLLSAGSSLQPRRRHRSRSASRGRVRDGGSIYSFQTSDEETEHHYTVAEDTTSDDSDGVDDLQALNATPRSRLKQQRHDAKRSNKKHKKPLASETANIHHSEDLVDREQQLTQVRKQRTQYRLDIEYNKQLLKYYSHQLDYVTSISHVIYTIFRYNFTAPPVIICLLLCHTLFTPQLSALPPITAQTPNQEKSDPNQSPSPQNIHKITNIAQFEAEQLAEFNRITACGITTTSISGFVDDSGSDPISTYDINKYQAHLTKQLSREKDYLLHLATAHRAKMRDNALQSIEDEESNRNPTILSLNTPNNISHSDTLFEIDENNIDPSYYFLNPLYLHFRPITLDNNNNNDNNNSYNNNNNNISTFENVSYITESSRFDPSFYVQFMAHAIKALYKHKRSKYHTLDATLRLLGKRNLGQCITRLLRVTKRKLFELVLPTPILTSPNAVGDQCPDLGEALENTVKFEKTQKSTDYPGQLPWIIDVLTATPRVTLPFFDWVLSHALELPPYPAQYRAQNQVRTVIPMFTIDTYKYHMNSNLLVAIIISAHLPTTKKMILLDRFAKTIYLKYKTFPKISIDVATLILKYIWASRDVFYASKGTYTPPDITKMLSHYDTIPENQPNLSSSPKNLQEYDNKTQIPPENTQTDPQLSQLLRFLFSTGFVNQKEWDDRLKSQRFVGKNITSSLKFIFAVELETQSTRFAPTQSQFSVYQYSRDLMLTIYTLLLSTPQVPQLSRHVLNNPQVMDSATRDALLRPIFTVGSIQSLEFLLQSGYVLDPLDFTRLLSTSSRCLDFRDCVNIQSVMKAFYLHLKLMHKRLEAVNEIELQLIDQCEVELFSLDKTVKRNRVGFEEFIMKRLPGPLFEREALYKAIQSSEGMFTNMIAASMQGTRYSDNNTFDIRKEGEAFYHTAIRVFEFNQRDFEIFDHLCLQTTTEIESQQKAGKNNWQVLQNSANLAEDGTIRLNKIMTNTQRREELENKRKMIKARGGDPNTLLSSDSEHDTRQTQHQQRARARSTSQHHISPPQPQDPRKLTSLERRVYVVNATVFEALQHYHTRLCPAPEDKSTLIGFLLIFRKYMENFFKHLTGSMLFYRTMYSFHSPLLYNIYRTFLPYLNLYPSQVATMLVDKFNNYDVIMAFNTQSLVDCFCEDVLCTTLNLRPTELQYLLTPPNIAIELHQQQQTRRKLAKEQPPPPQPDSTLLSATRQLDIVGDAPLVDDFDLITMTLEEREKYRLQISEIIQSLLYTILLTRHKQHPEALKHHAPSQYAQHCLDTLKLIYHFLKFIPLPSITKYPQGVQSFNYNKPRDFLQDTDIKTSIVGIKPQFLNFILQTVHVSNPHMYNDLIDLYAQQNGTLFHLFYQHHSIPFPHIWSSQPSDITYYRYFMYLLKIYGVYLTTFTDSLHRNLVFLALEHNQFLSLSNEMELLQFVQEYVYITHNELCDYIHEYKAIETKIYAQQTRRNTSLQYKSKPVKINTNTSDDEQESHEIILNESVLVTDNFKQQLRTTLRGVYNMKSSTHIQSLLYTYNIAHVNLLQMIAGLGYAPKFTTALMKILECFLYNHDFIQQNFTENHQNTIVLQQHSPLDGNNTIRVIPDKLNDENYVVQIVKTVFNSFEEYKLKTTTLPHSSLILQGIYSKQLNFNGICHNSQYSLNKAPLTQKSWEQIQGIGTTIHNTVTAPINRTIEQILHQDFIKLDPYTDEKPQTLPYQPPMYPLMRATTVIESTANPHDAFIQSNLPRHTDNCHSNEQQQQKQPILPILPFTMLFHKDHSGRTILHHLVERTELTPSILEVMACSAVDPTEHHNFSNIYNNTAPQIVTYFNDVPQRLLNSDVFTGIIDYSEAITRMEGGDITEADRLEALGPEKYEEMRKLLEKGLRKGNYIPLKKRDQYQLENKLTQQHKSELKRLQQHRNREEVGHVDKDHEDEDEDEDEDDKFGDLPCVAQIVEATNVLRENEPQTPILFTLDSGVTTPNVYTAGQSYPIAHDTVNIMEYLFTQYNYTMDPSHRLVAVDDTPDPHKREKLVELLYRTIISTENTLLYWLSYLRYYCEFYVNSDDYELYMASLEDPAGYQPRYVLSHPDISQKNLDGTMQSSGWFSSTIGFLASTLTLGALSGSSASVAPKDKLISFVKQHIIEYEKSGENFIVKVDKDNDQNIDKNKNNRMFTACLSLFSLLPPSPLRTRHYQATRNNILKRQLTLVFTPPVQWFTDQEMDAIAEEVERHDLLAKKQRKMEHKHMRLQEKREKKQRRAIIGLTVTALGLAVAGAGYLYLTTQEHMDDEACETDGTINTYTYTREGQRALKEAKRK